MDASQRNAVRLEERARLLVKVSEEVGEMINQCSAGDYGKSNKSNDKTKGGGSNVNINNTEPKNPQKGKNHQNEKKAINPPKDGKKPRQQSWHQNRGSQSMQNLSGHSTNRSRMFRGRGGQNYACNIPNQNVQPRHDYPPSYHESMRPNLLSNCAPRYAPPMMQMGSNPRLMMNVRPPPLPLNQTAPSMMQKQIPYTNYNPQSKQKKTIKKNIHPKQLITHLQYLTGFWTNITTMSKLSHLDYFDTLKCIKTNLEIFSLRPDFSNNGEFIVELSPKLSICSEYKTASGCIMKNCNFLHICETFLTRPPCPKVDCTFGHRVKTNHNNKILRSLSLEDIPAHLLDQLLIKVLSNFKVILFPRICISYQTMSCTFETNCKDLHICDEYVTNMGSCQNDSGCSLNHNIKIDYCVKIFNYFGLSTNDSPRDLLKLLNSNLKSSSQDVKKVAEKKKDENLKSSLDVKKVAEKNKDENLKSSQDVKKVAEKKKDENVKNKQPENINNNNTKLCWQLDGEIEIPYICFKRFEKQCDDTKDSCQYLHSKNKFHWQFKKEKWHNFHAFHSNILEKHYLDVNCDSCTISDLPKNYTACMKSYITLLGTDSMDIDFTAMLISGKNFVEPLKIRHITTESSVLTENCHSTTFLWYFRNTANKWIMYESNPKCSISSSEIEDAYLSKKNIFDFSGLYDYKINFAERCQINIKTGTIRAIRRRPMGTDTKKEVICNITLPTHWLNMKSDENYLVEKLISSSDEFNSIRQIVLQSSPSCSIIEIQRIQNKKLWKEFKDNETKIKGDQDFLNVQKLFYGIACLNELSNICKENLDFRVNQFPLELLQLYGKGTYLYNSFAIARRCCTADDLGIKQVLVLDVIIGHIVQGHFSMIQPPENPATHSLFDTTVDDINNPTTFVKYSKREYYPAYVVQFK